MSDIDTIQIPPIILTWSDWIAWDDFKNDVRNYRVRIPKAAGVYEVKYAVDEERLTIGKTSNLRQRVIQGLVRGTSPHSTGKKIRALEDTSRLEVRWATTERPAATEEELHRRYKDLAGKLPKHTMRT